MSLTLATKQFDQLNELIAGRIPHLEFQLVEKDVVDAAGSGWRQLLPYSSISAFDPASGELSFLAIQTNGQNEHTSALQSTKVGFGVDIDRKDDITCTSMQDVEEVGRVYHMTVRDILTTTLEACKRNWIDQIGFDPVEVFEIDTDTQVRFTFFVDPDTDKSEELVRFGVDVPLSVSPEQLVKVYEKVKDHVAEIETVREIKIGAGQMLLSFDVSETASKVIQQMTAEFKIEPWSVQVISRRLLDYFETVRAHVSYADIITAVKRNVETMQASMKEANEQAQAAAAAELQKQQDEAAGIQDAEVKQAPVGDASTAEQPAG